MSTPAPNYQRDAKSPLEDRVAIALAVVMVIVAFVAWVLLMYVAIQYSQRPVTHHAQFYTLGSIGFISLLVGYWLLATSDSVKDQWSRRSSELTSASIPAARCRGRAESLERRVPRPGGGARRRRDTQTEDILRGVAVTA